MEQEKKDLREAFKDNVEQLKQTPASTPFPSFGQKAVGLSFNP